MKRKSSFLMVIILLLSLTTSCEWLSMRKLERANIFCISEDKSAIIVDGIINSNALEDFKRLMEEQPDIKKLRFIQCDGSIDDSINLVLGTLIHKNRFNTEIVANGSVASGGTDLFLSGIYRTIGSNVEIGVHSWAGDEEVATDFEKGHKYHEPYIRYYQEIGMTRDDAEAFYYFTIYAAPADGIHIMTPEEIEQYKIQTE
ncbi:hypothetical protein K5X82_15060 [Halosquirtibacter xylanolyticus]|uniref:hypothetical protein n=1 Tax=Halosquirtibacter xylanolyticus TaxID=3374599 RepID=UPI00374A595B|nr:hypothetical protein K5X82_15060 [Prolixibacteraceae bacterium]